MAKFQFHLRAGFGFTRGSFLGRISVFFLLCPSVAGEISSSLKYNIDMVHYFSLPLNRQSNRSSVPNNLFTVDLQDVFDSRRLTGDTLKIFVSNKTVDESNLARDHGRL